METVDNIFSDITHSQNIPATSSESVQIADEFLPPPSCNIAQAARDDLDLLLRPRRKSGVGHKLFTGNDQLQLHMEQMKIFLHFYVHPFEEKVLTWTLASVRVAQAFQKGTYHARKLRKWTRAFIKDRHDLPYSYVPTWSISLLDHGDLREKLLDHLRTVGKYVCSLDVVEWTALPETQATYGLQGPISLSTAQVWMKKLDYRWRKSPNGQYIDGHEREDVTTYRQQVYLPKLTSFEPYTRKYDQHDEKIIDTNETSMHHQHIVCWYYDQSTFYANDCREVGWVHSSEKATPKAKGEGSSLMVADFVSADYGWLCSPDGIESARLYFRAGKNRDGYLTCQSILEQATKAMDILTKHYPQDQHYLVVDNASHQLARPPDALSARYMTKFPTQPGHIPFGVDTEVVGENGKRIFDRDGQVMKRRVQMIGGLLPDGSHQSFYFPPDHPNAEAFKGMVIILEERGFEQARQLRAECEGFKCPQWNPNAPCCCRRLLYNQPDFSSIEPALVSHCRQWGVGVIYLPKFHPELNCIEQCWGAAKRVYRQYPPSSNERVLEQNVRAALDTVSVQSIRR